MAKQTTHLTKVDTTTIQPQSLTVYDRTTGEAITVDAETVRIAHSCHDAIQSGLAQAAFFLHVMQQGRYYRGLGCSSFREYAESELNMGDSTARRYARIGGRLMPYADPDVLARALPESTGPFPGERSDDPHGHVERLQQLGTHKLDAILRGIDDDELEHFAQTGEIPLPNGGTTTFEEMLAKAKSKVIKDFRVQKKAISDRAKTFEAERDKALSERDDLAKKIETADELYQTGMALERRFSPDATGLDQQRKTLQEARATFAEFRRLMGRVQVTTDSDEEVRRLLWQGLNDARDLVDRLHVEHHDVIAVEVGLGR